MTGPSPFARLRGPRGVPAGRWTARSTPEGIKPEKLEQVLKVAADLGYKPNLAAKMLSDKQHSVKKIGIALVTEHNPFYDDVLRGINTALAEYADFGIENLIHIQQDYGDIKKQADALDHMAAQGVGGIVMNPIHCPEIASKINELNDRGIRTVTVNSDITQSRRIAYVGCHHRQSGVVMAGLLGLIANGAPMKVGVIAGPTHNLAVIRRKSGLLETIATGFSNIEVTAAYENENNEELSYDLTRQCSPPTLPGYALLPAPAPRMLRAVRRSTASGACGCRSYDLITEVRRRSWTGSSTPPSCRSPSGRGTTACRSSQVLAYNQLPERELNFTALSIITRYCLEEFEQKE